MDSVGLGGAALLDDAMCHLLHFTSHTAWPCRHLSLPLKGVTRHGEAGLNGITAFGSVRTLYKATQLVFLY